MEPQWLLVTLALGALVIPSPAHAPEARGRWPSLAVTLQVTGVGKRPAGARSHTCVSEGPSLCGSALDKRKLVTKLI